MLKFLSTSIIVVVTIALAAAASTLVSAESTEVLSLGFSSEAETLKHVDNVTECYNASGAAESYVDTVNGWYVFKGNNTGAGALKDEPIAVIQGYGESDGYGSYAVMPYNYSVKADFQVPATPGEGSFYVLLRYANVSFKYEVVVDVENNTLVFGKVVNGAWSSMKSLALGFNIVRGAWYTLEVNVTWEYNSSAGGYVNHIEASVYNSTNSREGEVWDDDLSPSAYNGLAFLGFDGNEEFKAYMDNVVVEAPLEKIGEEPHDEDIVPADLNVTEVYTYSDSSNIFIKLGVNSSIINATDTKYWGVELDLDRDSRVSESGWDYEYLSLTRLNSDGSSRSDLYDGSGDWVAQLHTLGGGIGYDYLVVQIPRNQLTGLGSSLYLYGYTQLGTTSMDGFPRDDVPWEDRTGDYYIWYLEPPSISWCVNAADSGDEDTTSYQYLNITYLREGYDASNMYYRLEVNSSIPWFGGSLNGTYQVLIDADQNVSTGYRYWYNTEYIGADYLVEMHIGYAPKLFMWNTSSDPRVWNESTWIFLKREDYTVPPGDKLGVTFLTPKSDYTGVPLGGSIDLIGRTQVIINTGGYTTSEQEDSTSDPQPAPVPETPLIALIAATTVMLAIARKFLNHP